MFQKLVNRAVYSDFESIRSAYITAVKMKNNRRDEARTWIQERLGYTELEDGVQIIDAGDYEYTTDGRVILRAQGKIWAISEEKYKDIIESTRKQIVQTPADESEVEVASVPKSILQGSSCNIFVGGQLCGGELHIVSVCPLSPLGKSGIGATATCTICGAKFAIPRTKA